MNGFFTKTETQSIQRPDGKTYTCHACGLYKNVVTPKMKPYGSFKKGILNIGEAPGETEDRRGKQWQGRAGKLLRQTYEELGIDLFKDCININAVNCRPTKNNANRTPTNYEIDCCSNIVNKTIEEVKPKVIILLGGSALYSIIGKRWNKGNGGIFKWRGFTIPDYDYNAWICPVLHPSYIMRGDKQEVITIWKQDLQRAFSMVEKPLPVYKEPTIHFIDDLSILDDIPNKSTIAFDYETTGLKPHEKGHRIVCASVAVSEDEVYTFMMPRVKNEREPFINLLRNKYIKKMAHNIKFEETWSLVRLGTRVKNWYWDSMLAAHILDNRDSTTSLKFQAYINFGVIDYSTEVTPFLQANSKSGNGMNTVLDLVKTESGKYKLLKYCALDSIYEYRLAKLQKEYFND